MRKPFYTAQIIGVAVFRRENDFRAQRRGSSTLAWNPEFLFKIAANMRNRLYYFLFVHTLSIILLGDFVKCKKIFQENNFFYLKALNYFSLCIIIIAKEVLGWLI